MARTARKPAAPYKTTVTWTPRDRQLYLLQLWGHIGGVIVLLLGAAVAKSVPPLGGVLTIVGIGTVMVLRLGRRLGFLRYQQPTVTHEGEYRSWVSPGLLIGIGVVLLFFGILFAMPGGRH